MVEIGSVFADLHELAATATATPSSSTDNNKTSTSNISRNSGLFFDPVTERVIAVRTEGNESVFSAHSLDDSNNLTFTFRTRERGRLRSICFSTDFQMVAIQLEDTVVDFLLLPEERTTVVAEFRQISRLKGAIILGIHWLGSRHIGFIMDAGCEFYSINPTRRSPKLEKTISLSVNWFNYYPPSKLFIFASGITNNMLMCMNYQNNSLYIRGKLEVDFGKSNAKPRLLERDIATATIYGHLCILALKFEPTNGYAMGINIFELSEEGSMPQPKLLHFLRLDLIGLVGMQIIDNLVAIHHKNAQKTLLFDTRLNMDGPIHVAPLHLHPKLAAHLHQQKHHKEAEKATFLYSSAWKMSPQGFIIDMRLEIFTCAKLDLNGTIEAIEDLEQKIQFLINRNGSERLLLDDILKKAILKKQLKFNRLTQLIRQILHNPSTSNATTSNVEASPKLVNNKLPKSTNNNGTFSPLIVSHNTILCTIFEPLYQHPDVDKQLLANLMIDFFLCLKQRKISIQNQYMPELLLKIVADAKMWTCLQQLLQYRVIDDSKFLAYELITLSAQCPPLYQIALDMLNRRGNSEQIAEVLLGRGHVLDALRFISEEPGESQRMNKICLKLIAAAWNVHPPDRPLMFTVYSHLEAIGKLRGLAESGNEDFERFSGEFKCLYDDQELKEAEQRFRLARLSSIRRGRRDSHRNTDSFTSTAGDENDQLLREILREQAEAAKTGNNNSGTGTMTNGSSSSASSSSGTSPYIAS